MTRASFFRLRLLFTGVVTIAIESLLLWNYMHGGIPRHHILADKNLPEISNIWGGLLLPILTWFLTWRIQKRIFKKVNSGSEVNIRPVVTAFICALLYAIIMATSFSLGYREVISNMMLAIFAIGLFLPVYRSEYLLGLVLGMTFTFGAVLPTGVGTIVCGITAILYLVVRRVVMYLFVRKPADRPPGVQVHREGTKHVRR